MVKVEQVRVNKRLRNICDKINSEFPVKLDLVNNQMIVYATGFDKLYIAVGKYDLKFVSSTVVGPFTAFTVTV